MSKDEFKRLGFGKIIKTARMERGGAKGWLVWDAFLINEITFQEDVIHKNTVLYRCWSDLEASEKFDELVKTYDGNYISDGDTGVKNDGIIRISAQYEAKLKEQAEAFSKDCEKWKKDIEDYEDLIKKYKDYIQELEKEKDKNHEKIEEMKIELERLQKMSLN